MQWIGSRKRLGRKKTVQPASAPIRRAALEALEPRWLFSTDIVMNANDSGAGSLRQTITSAAAGDTIQFAAALSGQTITLTTGQIAINQSLTIQGLGSGNLTVSGNHASSVFVIGSAAKVSITGLTITAGNGGLQNSGGDIYNNGTLSLGGDVVSNGSAEIGAGLFNTGLVTITGGTFSGSSANEQGGGIVNTATGTISLSGTTITGNTAAQEAGGGIANEGGSITLTACTVTGNTAATDGGGIANLDGSTLVLNDTAVTSNFARMWGAGILNFANATITINNASDIASNIALGSYGGGLFNYEGTANISNSTISGNFSVAVGAGVMSFLGNLTVTGSTFSNNGSSSVVIGGGLYTLDNLATLTSCVFIGNQAEYGAGIFADSGGELAVTQSTFQNNTADVSSGNGGDGAGIFVAGQAYISDSTIANNTADDDGGGILSDGTTTLVNDTIAQNVADNFGGGLFIGGLQEGNTFVNSETTAYNTIVATNTQGNAASDVINTFDDGLPAGEAPSQHDLIGSGGSGGLINGQNGNMVGASPDLGPLQYNGGAMMNLFTMAELTGSPATNAGINSLALDAFGNPLTTDERGGTDLRIENGTVDIGAYEVQTTNGPNSPAAVIASPTRTATTPAPPPSLLNGGIATPGFTLLSPNVSQAGIPYTPAEIDGAYGINDIFFNGVAGNGAGQTIAIIDAFNDPHITADAGTFSTDFNLPQFNTGGPTLQVLNENGGATLPTNASPGSWDVEESLDVEWAHAIAPDANIILFEANSANDSDLFTAATTAAATAGVSVVSMSFGSSQLDDFYGGLDEPSQDSTFTTPAGHQGVTFLASTGDDGAVADEYPALSPNVISVGGTSLKVGTDDSYLGESAWSGGGGGLSFEENQPSYQTGKVNGVTTEVRATPDVSMVADPQTGVEIIDTDFQASPFDIGGTSVATPLWAALISIVNQGRALKGETSLNGATQTLPMLYALPSSDFHDITTGDDGYAATTGYDLATGLGTPIANLLVPALAGFNGTAVWTGLVSNDWYNANNWNTFSVPNATTDVIINSGDPNAVLGFDIATLTINGGELTLDTGSGSSTATALTIGPSATLDVKNNMLFIDYGTAANPITTIAGYLTTGYNGGTYNGVGIDSSTAAVNPNYGVGYAASTDPNNPANLATDQIEIAFALNGDTNLDGIVNGIDFGTLSANFNKGMTGWDEGDFDYNNIINGIDFGDLATNFNKGATLAATISSASTNSPAALLINSPDPATTSINPVLDPQTIVGKPGQKATPAASIAAPKTKAQTKTKPTQHIPKPPPPPPPPPRKPTKHK